ncbi:hypothetical protein M3Y99_00636900 [Aphelenchoides fujianensis]|nr:hypothetical protein M3Y99_00636900 [Aphelenchoides fujianensis]
MERVRTQRLQEIIKEIGGCPMLDNPTTTWNKAAFDLTNTLVALTKHVGRHFFLDLAARFVPAEDKHLLMVVPGQLLMRDVTNYESDQDVQTLADFISGVMNILAQDMHSTKTHGETEEAVRNMLAFEREIAKILIAHKLLDGDEADAAITKKKAAELKKYSWIRWDDFVKDSALLPAEVRTYLQADPDVLIRTEAAFDELNVLMQAIEPEILADYLVTRLVINNIRFLDSRFVSLLTRFKNKLDEGEVRKDRKEMCFDILQNAFPLAADHLYIRKNFESKSGPPMAKMMDDLQAALKEMLKTEDWMDEPTRQAAEKKLEKLQKFVGGMPQVMDQSKTDDHYSKVAFDAADTPMVMLRKMRQHIAEDRLMRVPDPTLGKFDHSKFRSTALSALHSNEGNAVFLGAALLEPPFHASDHLPSSLNYGTLGWMVARELLHLFDEKGAEFDELGEQKNWWSDATRDKFNTNGQCIRQLYENEEEPQTHKNLGNKSWKENVADHGGIRLAYAAYQAHLGGKEEKHVPGYKKYTNQQAFFMSFATSRCNSRATQVIDEQWVESQDFAPDRFRVNLALANFPAFSEAFKCKPGAKMNPTTTCKLW